MLLTECCPQIFPHEVDDLRLESLAVPLREVDRRIGVVFAVGYTVT